LIAGSITQINLVIRDATGNLKTSDLFLNVTPFDLTLVSPIANSATFYSAGSVNVSATNVGGNANYSLTNPNGTVLNTQSSITAYNYSIDAPINGEYTLTITIGGNSISKKFILLASATPAPTAMPSNLKDGVNYNSTDSTKVSLVLNAPGKDFIYVAGNFNNWLPGSADVMKKDPITGKFWLEISNLIPNSWYAFQYWVCDNSPAVNSPKLVRTADPFSTLVLSPFDDPEIINLGVYPGLPEYATIAPAQQREVSVIQTGYKAYWNYNWKSTTKPNTNISKKDLMIYELLIRDFDSTRTYQSLINRMDYFKRLNINALQLMPVMEFEGNMSWGYNPVYHLAPDKRYGPPAKLKELIDSCHQNGIAVIFDIALNHVFPRSPLDRMWMVDTDNDGWSNGISPDNPYCNTVPKHTLNVGSDLNHFREPNNLTNTYVQRTVEQWMNEFNIDGFRWDLTQGFTNSCTANDDACTHSNQSDRIVKLKWYADMQWAIDPNFYVIFEHWVFGEIPEYTAYRLNETPSKGIMCWRRGDNEYANLLKGNATDISIISDASNYRMQGNIESHDEDRVAYKAFTEAGQTTGNLAKIHARMPALGSVFFLVPGSKMIWHFGELGCEVSVNTCNNGTVNGNCRLDTKPQYQWINNWLSNIARKKIYDDWGRLMAMRTRESVFRNGQHGFNQTTTGRPRLDVWTSTIPTTHLSYVMVHTNFTNSSVTFPAYFPYVGTWYNLMDNSPITVTNTTQSITLPADGGYVVYGNAPVNELPTYITKASGNWNAPATWEGNVVPPEKAGVLIKHAVTVTQNTNCLSVKVEPTGTVMVNSGIQLNIVK
jgi:glycosidase